MKEWDEATALAIVYSNTRRKKRRDDLVTVAGAMEYLAKLYGSQKAVAAKAGVHPEMIRQFLTVLRLPKSARDLFQSRLIDSVDVAKELAALNDPKEQTMAAAAMANTQSKDARDIKRLVKNGKYGVKAARKVVLDAKPGGLNVFVLDFDDDILDRLRREASKQKINVADLVRHIVAQWVRMRSKRTD